MTLNVDKHKDVLVAAWKEVMDEKNPTDWALFGYDGLSYDLNLVGKGDGGLDELNEDFNSGKIMYALCRVKIKEKNVEKVVLINWQGEGAPLARKGTCANHVSDVKSFFKGIHVTINARTDEDVDPDLILQTVAKATAGDGVKVSGSSEMDANVGPVGTVYKKVNPKEEINTSAKDEFWRKEEQEEERRKREEQNKLRRFSQNEVKLLRRESQDYFNDTEKVVPTNNASRVNGSNNISSAEAVKASTPLKSSSSNSGDLVRQRIKSFDHGSTPLTSQVLSNGASNGGSGDKSAESLSVLKRRQMFEGGAVHSTTASRVSPAQEIKKAQEEAQKLQKKQQESSISTTTNKPENKTPTPIKTPAAPIAAPVNLIPDVVPQPVKAVHATPPPPVVTEPVTNVVNVEKSNGHSINGVAKTSPIGDLPHNGNGHEQEHLQVEQNREEDAATPTIEILPEMGTCARALYDYQAADESEITFDPGDIITNIEQIDEGWWEGLGPHGVYGLFPANYVELLN